MSREGEAATRVPELAKEMVVVSSSGGGSRRWRVAAAAAAACALVATAGVVGSADGGVASSLMLQMQQLRALEGAKLPSYSPAALALAKSQREVQLIVVDEAKRKQAAANPKKESDEMAGGTSLTKKQLAKIVSSARAAAEKNNQLIYAADGALAASQQELGNDAATVSTLSTASNDMGHTFKSLINLASSDKSKSTQAALQAAQAAAKKNRKEMDDAANIMKESEEELGKDAISLPSLGDPKNGPSPLFKAVLKNIAHTKDTARGISQHTLSRLPSLSLPPHSYLLKKSQVSAGLQVWNISKKAELVP